MDEIPRPPVRLRAAVASLALAIALLVPAAAAAQQIPFAELGVSLWPEYDRPSMLVIYRITLDPGVQLPARVPLRIPAVAGAPNAVAEAGPSGDLVNAVYERRAEGEEAVLLIDANRPRLQVEYYDPRLDAGQPGPRRFTWRWPGGHGLEEIRVEVLEPSGASELNTVPPADSTRVGSDGLTRHLLTLSDLESGAGSSVEVRYGKSNDRLAVESGPGPGMAPPEPPTGDRARSQSASGEADGGVPPVLVGVMTALVAGGLAWWLLFGRQGTKEVSAGGAADEVDAGDWRFCPGCGVQTRAEDRFCHGCGRRLP